MSHQLKRLLAELKPLASQAWRTVRCSLAGPDGGVPSPADDVASLDALERCLVAGGGSPEAILGDHEVTTVLAWLLRVASPATRTRACQLLLLQPETGLAALHAALRCPETRQPALAVASLLLPAVPASAIWGLHTGVVELFIHEAAGNRNVLALACLDNCVGSLPPAVLAAGLPVAVMQSLVLCACAGHWFEPPPAAPTAQWAGFTRASRLLGMLLRGFASTRQPAHVKEAIDRALRAASGVVTLAAATKPAVSRNWAFAVEAAARAEVLVPFTLDALATILSDLGCCAAWKEAGAAVLALSDAGCFMSDKQLLALAATASKQQAALSGAQRFPQFTSLMCTLLPAAWETLDPATAWEAVSALASCARATDATGVCTNGLVAHCLEEFDSMNLHVVGRRVWSRAVSAVIRLYIQRPKDTVGCGRALLLAVEDCPPDRAHLLVALLKKALPARWPHVLHRAVLRKLKSPAAFARYAELLQVRKLSKAERAEVSRAFAAVYPAWSRELLGFGAVVPPHYHHKCK